MNSIDGRRLSLAGLAFVLVAPAAAFFLSAIGRSLQPVAHEPARTLDAIVAWFEALPGPDAAVLLVVLPLAGIILAAWLLWRAWAGDPTLHAEVAALTHAAAAVARRPTFLVAILVLAFGVVYLVAAVIHGIAG